VAFVRLPVAIVASHARTQGEGECKYPYMAVKTVATVHTWLGKYTRDGPHMAQNIHARRTTLTHMIGTRKSPCSRGSENIVATVLTWLGIYMPDGPRLRPE
jgi:hypothetical protein